MVAGAREVERGRAGSPRASSEDAGCGGAKQWDGRYPLATLASQPPSEVVQGQQPEWPRSPQGRHTQLKEAPRRPRSPAGHLLPSLRGWWS